MANVVDRAGQATDYLNRKGETQPVVGALGSQITQQAQGIGQLFQGKKAGFKNIYESARDTVTEVGGLAALNDPGKRAEVGRSSYGGSQEAAAALALRNQSGIDRGQGAVNTALGQANQNVGAAYGILGSGLGLGQSGVSGQDRALGASLSAANRSVGSLAAAQQQQAGELQARQMMAMAASARGGNQAAAMQAAQAQASANALQTQQSLGLARLAEEQQQRGLLVQANQFAAGAMGDRAGLGYGTALSALGQAGNATGQIGQLGTTVQGQYLGAQTSQDNAQIAADSAQAMAQAKIDEEYNKNKAAARGGVMGFVGKAIGSMYGGG